jgi:uncharacterized protein YdiU (UPF0061 family)
MTIEAKAADLFAFDNSYARLPDRFFSRFPPTPVAAPRLIRLNENLARELGLDARKLGGPEGVAILSGSEVPRGGTPLAMAYAGHQFGHFVPQLGDGRALLLGEIIDRNGVRRDIQLKGAGPTPFSRLGDGRAALGPILREYIVGEAMAALNIPTTRALAAVATGETVRRETQMPGAVLTRVASSHIRVGTFQFFAAREDVDALKRLADYVIARHYPDIASAANPYRSLLDVVVARQAELVAKWLFVGFIHGVMNTDNMSIAGETIDYGPCAFMDAYDPQTVYSSIDRFGRYAYANQSQIAYWNLARLAEAFLPLLAGSETDALEEAQAAIDAFASQFESIYAAGLSAKLGLFRPRPDDLALANDLLERMAANGADFTLTFRGLCDAASSADGDAAVRRLFDDPGVFDDWAVKWRQRLGEEGGEGNNRREAMRALNPMFIPRNHLVEEAIGAAVNEEDFSPFETLLNVLSNPFEDQPEYRRYTEPPRPDQVVHQTFCGT